MRRALFWYLPLAAALLAVGVFGYGFASYLRGDTGTPVDLAAAGAAAASTTAASTTAASTAPSPSLVAPLILGDSLARGTGDETGLGIGGRLDDELRRRHVRARRSWNLGVNGARTADLIAVVSRPNVEQLMRESNAIVVSIGGNDLWGGTDWRNAPPPDPERTMAAVLERIASIVARIRAANPRARIFFIGLYNPFALTPQGAALTPLVNRWNARLLARFGADPNFTLVPTADLFAHHDRLSVDRFHPNGEGYALIARRIADAL
jgi:lysophospholipase L1-like esterase